MNTYKSICTYVKSMYTYIIYVHKQLNAYACMRSCARKALSRAAHLAKVRGAEALSRAAHLTKVRGAGDHLGARAT